MARFLIGEDRKPEHVAENLGLHLGQEALTATFHKGSQDGEVVAQTTQVLCLVTEDPQVTEQARNLDYLTPLP